jgi:hypothetical protein
VVFRQQGREIGERGGFTRSPSRSEKALYGKFIVNAQGEDAIAVIVRHAI